MIFRWFVFFLIIIGFNWYSSLAIKTVTKSTWINYIYCIVNLLIVANFIFQININRENGIISPVFSYSFGLFIVSIIFQISLIFVLFIEDFIRIPIWLFHFFSKGMNKSFNYMPERRLFISQLSILIASIPASALFIGMLRGKYNYKCRNF